MNLTQDKVIAAAKEAGLLYEITGKPIVRVRNRHDNDILEAIFKFAELLTNSDAEPVDERKAFMDYWLKDVPEQFKARRIEEFWAEDYMTERKITAWEAWQYRASHSKAEQDADTKRLDWLDKHNGYVELTTNHGVYFYPSSPAREIIDQAITKG
jgi:hypothetical protein